MNLNPETVTLMALEEQIRQAKTWLLAAELTLKTLTAKRAPQSLLDTANPPTVPTAAAPQVEPETVVVSRRRSKAEILKDALEEGIPSEAIGHPALLGPKGLKPTHQSLDLAEKLVQQVKQAKGEGKDPQPFWTAYLPPT